MKYGPPAYARQLVDWIRRASSGVNPLRWLYHVFLEDDDRPPSRTDRGDPETASEVEANIWQDMLATEGIRCLLVSYGRLAVYGTLAFDRWIRLRVRYADVQRAREILGLGEEAENDESRANAGHDT